MGSVASPTTPAPPYYWSILGHDWATLLAIDEFGQGTLDGNVAHGGSFDACGPAALENVTAAFLGKPLSYAQIGLYRADMITQGLWTAGATVQNPRTNGCYIQNIAQYMGEITGGVFQQSKLITDNGPLVLAQIHTLLSGGRGGMGAVIWIVTNAQALTGNEQNVHGHFVATVAYDSGSDKQYILNSDIAGQHGIAQGQWTDMATFQAAVPVGGVVLNYHPAPPSPPPFTLHINGTLITPTPTHVEVNYG